MELLCKSGAYLSKLSSESDNVEFGAWIDERGCIVGKPIKGVSGGVAIPQNIPNKAIGLLHTHPVPKKYPSYLGALLSPTDIDTGFRIALDKKKDRWVMAVVCHNDTMVVEYTEPSVRDYYKDGSASREVMSALESCKNLPKKDCLSSYFNILKNYGLSVV